jgi:hypothetical protein
MAGSHDVPLAKETWNLSSGNHADRRLRIVISSILTSSGQQTPPKRGERSTLKSRHKHIPNGSQ